MPAPERKAAPYLFLGQTTSLCETCYRLVPRQDHRRGRRSPSSQALPRARRAEDADRRRPCLLEGAARIGSKTVERVRPRPPVSRPRPPAGAAGPREGRPLRRPRPALVLRHRRASPKRRNLAGPGERRVLAQPVGLLRRDGGTGRWRRSRTCSTTSALARDVAGRLWPWVEAEVLDDVGALRLLPASPVNSEVRLDAAMAHGQSATSCSAPTDCASRASPASRDGWFHPGRRGGHRPRTCTLRRRWGATDDLLHIRAEPSCCLRALERVVEALGRRGRVRGLSTALVTPTGWRRPTSPMAASDRRYRPRYGAAQALECGAGQTGAAGARGRAAPQCGLGKVERVTAAVGHDRSALSAGWTKPDGRVRAERT